MKKTSRSPGLPVFQSKIKDYPLCVISAILLVLSFPNFNLWILAWVGFVPLFLAIQGKSKLKAFSLAYLAGIIFWFGIIYWLIHVTLPGTIVLILYLALYFGVFGLIVRAYSLKLTTYSLFFIPSIWVLLEYLRSRLFTGFPWALLGYSQYLNLPVIQIADIAGAWGVSFLVMMVNVTIWKAMAGRRVTGNGLRLTGIVVKKKLVLPLLFILAILNYGYYKIHRIPYPVSRIPLRISLIQGNIPQELKWEFGQRKFITDKYLALSAQAAKEKTDLLVWPEASLPSIIGEEGRDYERVRAFIREIRTPLLLGAVRREDDSYYNSALLLSEDAKSAKTYDKLHLVPFGEYIPLRNILPFLQTIVPIGDVTAGKEYTVFSLTANRLPVRQAGTPLNPINFSVLICFEDLFPELSREFVKRGSGFLINITNDAWYKRTSAATQHLQASVFRAVENRVFLARAANTGISGLIAPTGKIIAMVADESGRDIFVDGYVTQEIPLVKRGLSLYTRYGDVFVAACFLLALFGITASKRGRFS